MVDFPKIRKIYIKNFRSISEVEFDTTDFTILVGNNDCGKSNVFRALNLFFNGETNLGEKFDFENDYNKFAPIIAKKAQEIIVELTIEPPESYHENAGQFILWRKAWRKGWALPKETMVGLVDTPFERKSGSRLLADESLPTKLSRARSLLRLIQFEYVPAIRSPLYLRKLRGRIYEAIAATSESDFRKKSSAFEKSIGKSLGSLTDTLKGKLADDTTLRLPNDLSDLFESLDFLSGDKSISLSNRGDGVKGRYIPFLLKFIADKLYDANTRKTFIWAYEEPENNLEFNKSLELSSDLIEFAEEEEIQIFLTTHSPVFYNLSNSNSETCTAFHLSKKSSDEGTVCVPVSELDGHLDEHMGAMTFIAPYVARANSDLHDALKAKADLESELQKTNPENLPTIFVEGNSDYKLYSGIIRRFFSSYVKKFHLFKPPSNGGAEHVFHSLLAWELRQKNKKKANRVFALGLVDADSTPSKAQVKYEEHVVKGSLSTSYQTYAVPNHLAALVSKGFQLQIALEELYPPEEWLADQHVGQFLKNRPQEEVTFSPSLEFLKNGFEYDSLTEEEKVYIENKPMADAKGTWVDDILSRSDEDVRITLRSHIKELNIALRHLKIIPILPGME